MRSWSSMLGRHPTTSAGIFSVLAPLAEAAVAEVGGEPVGFALWFTTFSTFRGQPGLYLEDIFVKPAYRGRGIGKGLLAAVARRAVERGCGRLEWSVLNWNAPAIGFYQSLGARPMDEWTVYRIDEEPLRRLGGDRARVVSVWNLISRGPVFDEPLRSTPYRPDGRLRARRAAPGGRIHQAQYQ